MYIYVYNCVYMYKCTHICTYIYIYINIHCIWCFCLSYSCCLKIWNHGMCGLYTKSCKITCKCCFSFSNTCIGTGTAIYHVYLNLCYFNLYYLYNIIYIICILIATHCNYSWIYIFYLPCTHHTSSWRSHFCMSVLSWLCLPCQDGAHWITFGLAGNLQVKDIFNIPSGYLT